MTDFVMPKAGITMDEGTVVEWLVKVGDPFKEGQPLAVVETDKASIEVNANADGVMLAILVEPG
ncbi:MAG: dehydrogenase, partial [Firmicutes bacterium]|nr:dehydrogenase [Bacillota bacterium]